METKAEWRPGSSLFGSHKNLTSQSQSESLIRVATTVAHQARLSISCSEPLVSRSLWQHMSSVCRCISFLVCSTESGYLGAFIFYFQSYSFSRPALNPHRPLVGRNGTTSTPWAKNNRKRKWRVIWSLGKKAPNAFAFLCRFHCVYPGVTVLTICFTCSLGHFCANSR